MITAAIIVLWVLAVLLMVDLVTGIMHWAEDTWAPLGTSEFLDKYVVRDNIEHHRRPGIITSGSYFECNRVCMAMSLVAFCGLLLFRVHAWQAYLFVAMASQSNQVHAWAHDSKAPRFARWLQSIGVFQSRRHHAEHHRSPYAIRFCTTTNFLNPILDGVRFWRGLELLIESCGVKVQRATASRGGF